MENKNQDYIPGQWSSNSDISYPKKTPKSPKRFSLGVVISIACIVAAISVLFTYTVTSAFKRSYYSEKLAEQQKVIDALQNNAALYDVDFEKLELLAELFDRYSYYAGEKTDEELLTAVLKAYAAATGDAYAEYYTEEEYAALTAENAGDYEGIGVSVIQTTLTVDGFAYQVFQVISVYQDSPAGAQGLQVGDCIYSVKTDGVYQSVSALGYTKAISLIKGPVGTLSEFVVFRQNGTDYDSIEFSVPRAALESVSVSYCFSNADSTVGIVKISSFDLTTPRQFKKAVQALLANGAEHFVFDVRNNPGGDLQSIKAVLTYFLQDGDLILSAIDRDGNVARSYFAEKMTHIGDYASCNVAENEIGMFADLDIAVLCNGNTASAAEVFTATLRDYGLATIVGETTFGKGIMQSYLPLSSFGEQFSGYIKMTTYAYVTKCGVTYHEIGIAPGEGCEVALSEEAKQYNIYVLPQELDNQLVAAIAQLR